MSVAPSEEPTAAERARQPEKQPRYFYGWNIVGASFAANLAASEHHSSILGFFIRPLNQEYGWTRTNIAFVQTIARLTEALVAPLVGPYADRYGPRLLMPIGALIVGLSLILVTQVDALWQFYVLRGIVGACGFMLMGNLVTTVAIMNWFVKRRGRAVAIAGMGVNIGSMIMTPVTVWVIANSGWRTSYIVFGVLTWLVVLVPSLVLMRRRPEDMGLYPDGADGPPRFDVPDEADAGPDADPDAPRTAREPVWNRREVMATSSFWFLVISFAFANLSFQGVNISLAPYVQDLGYGDAFAATLVTMRSAIMAGMMIPWGPIGDRATSNSVIRVAPFVLQGIASACFMMAGTSPVFLFLAVGIHGLGFAGTSVVQEVIWSGYYGRLSLGLVRSMAFPFALGFAAVGPVFMNLIFDITGSYQFAYVLFIGFYAIATTVLWICRSPVPKRFADSPLAKPRTEA